MNRERSRHKNAPRPRRFRRTKGKSYSLLVSLCHFSIVMSLRLAYRVAQVRHADTRDHRRVAKDGRRAVKVVKESNSGAQKNCRDVNVDFVEEAGIKALLDGVGAVDPNGLSGSGGLDLVHGA